MTGTGDTATTFDAIVIGGGPAGSTAALLLAKAGWSVAIVERAAFPRRKVCGEFVSATNLPLLRELGVADAFGDLAGPEVRRVGLFARREQVVARMPRLQDDVHGWGRAVGREYLDQLLLDRAHAEGAQVWQPWTAVHMERGQIEIAHVVTHDTTTLSAPVVIAAHGSWESGVLSTQPERQAPRASDLFGFKAHFVRASLPAGLMPLLAFPGGYGGMVHSDHGRVSLSCCVRRDRLEQCRQEHRSISAGEAVLAHIKATCEPVRDVLARAMLDEEWRAAGPIRPGIRSTMRNGAFLIGNAAGEAHPAVAEGISMAMQSAWLLAHRLTETRDLDEVRTRYNADWRQTFAARIHAASFIAHWAMSSAFVRSTLPLLQAFPAVLTEGARTSGKVAVICSPSF